jgi:hypothetical protein
MDESQSLQSGAVSQPDNAGQERVVQPPAPEVGRPAKRKLLWIALPAGLILALLLVVPYSRDALLSVMRREPWVGGRPLSTWIEALEDADPDRRHEAIDALGELGPEAAPAIPALAEVAHNATIGTRSWAISEGLGRIGRPAVPVLCELLDDRSVRTVVICTLGQMGPQAEEAVPRLIPCLKDELWLTRVMTAATLGKIGPPARAAVPALKACLHNQDSAFRQEAALALRKIDPNAAQAVPDDKKAIPAPLPKAN